MINHVMCLWLIWDERQRGVGSYSDDLHEVRGGIMGIDGR